MIVSKMEAVSHDHKLTPVRGPVVVPSHFPPWSRNRWAAAAAAQSAEGDLSPSTKTQQHCRVVVKIHRADCWLAWVGM